MGSVKQKTAYFEKQRCMKKQLKYSFESGDKNKKYVFFEDENGELLTWLTTDATRIYQNLQIVATYDFTVNYILEQNDGSPLIAIRNLKVVETEDED